MQWVQAMSDTVSSVVSVPFQGEKWVTIRWRDLQAVLPDWIGLPDRMPCHLTVRNARDGNPFPRHFHARDSNGFIHEVEDDRLPFKWVDLPNGEFASLCRDCLLASGAVVRLLAI